MQTCILLEGTRARSLCHFDPAMNWKKKKKNTLCAYSLSFSYFAIWHFLESGIYSLWFHKWCLCYDVVKCVTFSLHLIFPHFFHSLIIFFTSLHVKEIDFQAPPLLLCCPTTAALSTPKIHCSPGWSEPNPSSPYGPSPHPSTSCLHLLILWATSARSSRKKAGLFWWVVPHCYM